VEREDGAGGRTEDLLGDAAGERPREALAAARPQDDEVGVDRARQIVDGAPAAALTASRSWISSGVQGKGSLRMPE
jgi:hypothetical protein